MKPVFLVFLSLAILVPALWASAQITPSLDAYLRNADGTAVQTNIPSSPVDLLFDADSYVPPFYRGRALPSAGTNMHLQALARFGGVPDSQITYTWRRNGQVESSVSGAGRSSISLTAPTLFGTDTISVDARTADGSMYGSASVAISSIDPRATLYQDHPLFGIEYYNALTPLEASPLTGLTDQNSIPDLEMTFAAVPYFAQASNPNDPRLAYAWSVNGAPVSAATTSLPAQAGGSEITINAQNSSGLAAISLLLTSPINFLLHGEGSWNVLFSREGLGTRSAQNPGTSGGIFHTGIAR